MSKEFNEWQAALKRKQNAQMNARAYPTERNLALRQEAEDDAFEAERLYLIQQDAVKSALE